MSHDAHVARAQAQLPADPVGTGLGIEGEHDDAALALRQAFETPGQALEVDGRLVANGSGRQRGPEAFEEPFPPLGPAPQPGDDAPAGSEHEGREELGLAHLARAQHLEGHEERVLNEVVGRCRVPQMPEAVEANPRREPAVQLGLDAGVSACEATCQIGVARVPFSLRPVQGGVSISGRPFELEV